MYEFTLTPRRAGPYRVFADIVPALSSVQEYAVCDLPSAQKGEALFTEGSATASTVDGRRFDIAWAEPNLPFPSQQSIDGNVTVTGADGKPFNQLEQVMGTFAHLVAFHEDRQTVLHLHPTGGDPESPDERGGPQFPFRFWAPKPGFYRLYVQVQIGGAQVFAPFVVRVKP